MFKDAASPKKEVDVDRTSQCWIISGWIEANNAEARKAPYAERRDVVYKSLMRSTRKFLRSKFDSEFGVIKFSGQTKGCPIFLQKMKAFFEKYFKNDSEELMLDFNISEKIFWETIATFMRTDIYLPNREEKYKSLTLYLKKAFKSFSLPTFTRLFSFEPVQCLFKALQACGYIQEMIDSKPNLKRYEETYKKAVDSIINYGQTHALID